MRSLVGGDQQRGRVYVPASKIFDVGSAQRARYRNVFTQRLGRLGSRCIDQGVEFFDRCRGERDGLKLSLLHVEEHHQRLFYELILADPSRRGELLQTLQRVVSDGDGELCWCLHCVLCCMCSVGFRRCWTVGGAVDGEA
jgi:hypothetical protein